VYCGGAAPLAKRRAPKDASELEFGQLSEYQTLKDLGHCKDASPPPGYKKIHVHLVFDVKHDGRHKARVVADGHPTDIPLDSVYSSVVSLRGLRIMIFLAELYELEVWSMDIRNAYLQAHTQEKLYSIIAGPAFGELQNHILVIEKALYSLRSLGKRWHEQFAGCLKEEGFLPCKTEPNIWMQPAADKSCYKVVAVYVDDLAFGIKEPIRFLEVLEDKHKFKLKGSGPISFHLGCHFERGQDGPLSVVPKQYIERMVNPQYKRMFACKPNKLNVSSPLDKGDHPETNTTEFLDTAGQQQYQSLIGSLQWAIIPGRIDVTTMAVLMTMSSFRAQPCVGHLNRVKQMRVSGSVLMSLIFPTYLYLPMIGLTLHTDPLMRTCKIYLEVFCA
jgi:Reverse transcriptase (RNA-dependent DNA polymerase)